MNNSNKNVLTCSLTSDFILAVCSLRLDFETFTTQGLSATTELAAITCQDTFIVSVSYSIENVKI